MKRLEYPLSQEWHVAINRHSDDQRAAGKDWEQMRFMYEAKKAGRNRVAAYSASDLRAAPVQAPSPA